MSGSSRDGGEAERLAPVIPLFGGTDPTPVPDAARATSRADRDETRPAERWHTTWVAETRRGTAMSPNPSAGGVSAAAVVPPTGDASAPVTDAGDDRMRAERSLLKRLRGRSLSVREARAVLGEGGIDEGTRDEIITAFLDNGYLDDSRLAEQLLDGALGRKAQGAQAISQTLARRGLERDVIDIALASLPDDEDERALEFARGRARGMTGLDPDTALRRLHGQLARRGFGGSRAMSAARQALDELR
ncbi:regulatory protein RecX [Microbacterium oleivorans]|uniref:Regulatory protein RecX n=1 Tax=Microbacterium oleivorans TaxID=273677 RepID=A0A7D5ETD9_9MICO|nr:regulatory protein RecX [Microbacterium oleivorans]QLD12705.1 regulatory protein RecX [Microbacterium oleivorans]